MRSTLYPNASAYVARAVLVPSENYTIVRLGFLLCLLDQGLQRLVDIEHAEALGHVLGRDCHW